MLVLLLATQILLIQLAVGMSCYDNKRESIFAFANEKQLTGHTIEQRTVTSPLECSHFCLRNTSCLSFNYKRKASELDGDVCELNNGTRLSSPLHYQEDSQYDYYFDPNVENFKSCLGYLRNGANENGIYTITDISGDFYQVFCDLTSEPRSAWTLILSLSFKNRHMAEFCSKPLFSNAPVQENTPNWEAYRLSFDRMQRLSQQTTHVRITTGFTEYGVDFRDYLKAKQSSLDILTINGNNFCKVVEYIDVRGHKAQGATVAFFQDNISFLHTDTSSKFACEFDGTVGASSSENDFGAYCYDANPKFRGAERNDSTTEWWFGGNL